MNMLREKLQTLVNLPHTIERELGNIHTRISLISSKIYEVIELLQKPEHNFVQILIFGNVPVRPPIKGLTPNEAALPEKDDYGFHPSPFMERFERVPGPPCSLADSAYVNGQHMFSFQPFAAIVNPKIIIVCDTSKIRIDSVKCANENLSLSMENAPVCFYEGRVGPENRITVVVSSRTR